jgi:hypothetical protein
MNQTEPYQIRNYVPHSKWGQVRKFDNYEEYLRNLSTSVTAACNRFFRKRGMESYQMGGSIKFNSESKST